MNPKLKHAFQSEMAAASFFFRKGQLDRAFRHLERAHVLGQRYARPHIQAHWLMLRIGLRRHSAREVWGQALRIVLGALGSAAGIVPTGNTGGTDVGMLRRMPVAPEIAHLLGAGRRTEGSDTDRA